MTAAHKILLGVLITISSMSRAQEQHIPGRILMTEEPCSGQTFDVASVKPSDPSVSSALHQAAAPGDYNVTGVTIVDLIQNAYGVLPFQIDDGHSKQLLDRYDVYAKLPHTASEIGTRADWALAFRSQAAALRCLLYDRFKLRFQINKKLHPAYELKIEKNGPKFNPTGTSGKLLIRRGFIQTDGSSIAVLIDQIAAELNAIVLNETGLDGNFNYKLEWSPDNGQEPPTDSLPPISVALSQQLGLKLQNEKRPIDVIQITHIEKPSPN